MDSEQRTKAIRGNWCFSEKAGQSLPSGIFIGYLHHNRMLPEGISFPNVVHERKYLLLIIEEVWWRKDIHTIFTSSLEHNIIGHLSILSILKPQIVGFFFFVHTITNKDVEPTWHYLSSGKEVCGKNRDLTLNVTSGKTINSSTGESTKSK